MVSDAFGSEPEPVPVSRDADTGALDPEWDEAFGWSYGRRVWNVGCG